MDKLKIGVIVYQESNPTDGGGHSYYETLLNGINVYDFNSEIEIINVVFRDQHAEAINMQKPTIYITGKLGSGEKIKKRVKNLSSSINLKTFFTRKNPLVHFLMTMREEARKEKIERILRENNIDLIYYLKPEADVLNYPFITTHWDIAHRSTAGFPETSLDGHYKLREDYYLYTLSKAFLILCESITGAEELKQYYSIYEEKIKVVPLFASNIIKVVLSENAQLSILKVYGLEKNSFFVYPAQFWSHKNHYNLILAFKTLVSRTGNTRLKLILPGSDKGNLAYILKHVHSLALVENVVIPGFVSADDLYTFYKNAIALVMPTFLGPTNIPLIEAAHLKCAVACSDLPGHRELLEANALYFNPADPEAISVAMQQTMNDDTRLNLVHSASTYIENSPFLVEKSLQKINEVLVGIKPVRKTWGVSHLSNSR